MHDKMIGRAIFQLSLASLSSVCELLSYKGHHCSLTNKKELFSSYTLRVEEERKAGARPLTSQESPRSQLAKFNLAHASLSSRPI